jgi:hypothetical protein
MPDIEIPKDAEIEGRGASGSGRWTPKGWWRWEPLLAPGLLEALGTLAWLGTYRLWRATVGADSMQCRLWPPTDVFDACPSAYAELWSVGPQFLEVVHFAPNEGGLRPTL